MVYNIFNSVQKQGDDKMKKIEVRQKIQIIFARIIVLIACITMFLNICLSNKVSAATTWCNSCHSNSVVAEYYNPYFHRYICNGCNTVYGNKEEHSKKNGICTICNQTLHESSEDSGGTNGGGTKVPAGLPDLELFEPTISLGGTTTIIGQILGILRILGAITIVVAIAVIGFNTILGSANEKAEYQQKLVGVLFAGIFLVASTSIAKLIMSVAATI